MVFLDARLEFLGPTRPPSKRLERQAAHQNITAAGGVAEKTANQGSPFRQAYPQADILLRGHRLGAQTERRAGAGEGSAWRRSLPGLS
jgi:hypothetical protein